MLTKEKTIPIDSDNDSNTLQIRYPLDIFDVYNLAIKLNDVLLAKLNSLADKPDYKQNETIIYLIRYHQIQKDLIKSTYYNELNHQMGKFYESGGLKLLESLDENQFSLIREDLNDCFSGLAEQLGHSVYSTDNKSLDALIICLQLRNCAYIFFNRLSDIYPSGELRDELKHMAEIYHEASINLCEYVKVETLNK